MSPILLKVEKMKSSLLEAGMCIPLTSLRNDKSLPGNQPCVTLISVRIPISLSLGLTPSASVLFFHRLIHSCRVSWWRNCSSDSIVLYSLGLISRYSMANLNLFLAEIISVTREISSSFNVMMLDPTLSEKLKICFEY